MRLSIEALDDLVLLISNQSPEKDKRILLGAAAKAMAWLPFTMETCINGREALKKDFEDAGIACETYGNCFTGISDVEMAQSISNAFALKDHSAGFEKTAGLANPFYETVKSQAREGCSRFIRQGEAATDIMFVDSERLQNIYSSIVEFAINCFSCKDVSGFMGKSLRTATRER